MKKALQFLSIAAVAMANGNYKENYGTNVVPTDGKIPIKSCARKEHEFNINGVRIMAVDKKTAKIKYHKLKKS